MKAGDLGQLAKLIRYYILTATTAAGSGHPSSSLSAADLMTVLYFGGFLKYDLTKPNYHNNDRVIFSKGHAAPLLYALYAAAGKVTEKELKTLRKFNSRLEGHPTAAFPYTEAATGSLGQGLSVGVGMALNAKIDRLPYKTYVLLGDSEMTEGSIWEAIQLAAHYKLDNLVGIIDVNRLGQRGATIYGHNISAFSKRVGSFGWKTIEVDGHDLAAIAKAYQQAAKTKGKPTMIVAKTIKGKGVSFIENKNGWHGKVLNKKELAKALTELEPVNLKIRGKVSLPKKVNLPSNKVKAKKIAEQYGKPLATRKAYGHALVKLYPKYPDLVVLDAEVSNSTYAETFKNAYPKRFFEMFIAEQNMVGVAVGLAARGKIPFISTFAAFFTRAFDQIRMAQYSGAGSHINFVGSHAGTAIGQDGSSQMGLEDIAMFRAVLDSVVLYPSDHVSDEKLVAEAIKHPGICYLRTTRSDTSDLYKPSERFPIGGSKTLKRSAKDKVTVVAAGITLYEALAAYDELQKEKINIRVIDLYSVKPIDAATLKKAARETGAVIVVEDHFEQGGIGEAVRTALQDEKAVIHSLAVRKMPKSGQPQQLLAYENIDRQAIVRQVKKMALKWAEMKRRIVLDNREIDYTHRRTRRAKQLTITVRHDATLLVSSPHYYPLKFIEGALQKRSNWILKQILRFQNSPYPALIRQRHDDYPRYKAAAYESVVNVIKRLNGVYRFSFQKISIKRQSTIWGSCSPNGNLSFNYKILFLPVELAEYVIAHELCHLRELNHSKNFWRLVSLTVPNHLEHRKRLAKIHLI